MCARSDLTFQTLCWKIFTKWHAICIEPHYSTMFLNHHGLHMALINDHIIALVAEPIQLEILILWGFRVNSRYNLDYEHRWNGNAASSWPLYSFFPFFIHQGLLPPKSAKQCDILLLKAEELPYWPNQSQPLPALPLAEVSSVGHEPRWWVKSYARAHFLLEMESPWVLLNAAVVLVWI